MTQVSEPQAVHVKGRFHRSVQLTKDWQGPCTDSKRLPRYADSPRPSKPYYWRIRPCPAVFGLGRLPGPYGTGKSSFALFLSRLLAQETEGLQTEALTVSC